MSDSKTTIIWLSLVASLLVSSCHLNDPSSHSEHSTSREGNTLNEEYGIETNVEESLAGAEIDNDRFNPNAGTSDV